MVIVIVIVAMAMAIVMVNPEYCTCNRPIGCKKQRLCAKETILT